MENALESQKVECSLCYDTRKRVENALKNQKAEWSLCLSTRSLISLVVLSKSNVNFCGASIAERHLGITLSVCLSVRLSHIRFAYNFFTFRGRAFIFGMCVLYDNTFPMVPLILSTWPSPSPLTYIGKIFTLHILAHCCQSHFKFKDALNDMSYCCTYYYCAIIHFRYLIKKSQLAPQAFLGMPPILLC